MTQLNEKKKALQVQVVSDEYIGSYERLISDWLENLSANQMEVISNSPLVQLSSEKLDHSCHFCK